MRHQATRVLQRDNRPVSEHLDYVACLSDHRVKFENRRLLTIL